MIVGANAAAAETVGMSRSIDDMQQYIDSVWVPPGHPPPIANSNPISPFSADGDAGNNTLMDGFKVLVALLFTGIRTLHGTQIDPATLTSRDFEHIALCFEATGWSIILEKNVSDPRSERSHIAKVLRAFPDALPYTVNIGPVGASNTTTLMFCPCKNV